MILDDFRRTIQVRGLLLPGDRVLVAVSGGGDSVALLRLLLEYSREVPLVLVVAHVNHRLRGQAADEDEQFVASLAAQFGLECVVHFPQRAGQTLQVKRGEEGARLVRHALLRKAARAARCDRIALGHTMDDQAETVLMRLVRGAGRHGLSGMAYAGPGRLVRPMLGLRRDEAHAWLGRIGQDFRLDETNAQPRFLRNRIRSRLLPLLAEMNPSIVRTLSRNAVVMAEEDAWLDLLAGDWVTARASPDDRHAGGLKAPARELAMLPPVLARRAVRMLLRRAGADPRGAALVAVEQVIELAAGSGGRAELILAGGFQVVRDGSELVIGRGDAACDSAGPLAPFSLPLEVPGGVRLPRDQGSLTARVVPRGELSRLPGERTRIALDAELLGGVVTVRTRLPGDTFHPLGAQGHRKLKEFLIDCKIPRQQRDKIPLVVGPAGIAWVVGHRIAHGYRVIDRTRAVAVLEYIA